MKKIAVILCPMPMEFEAVENHIGRLGETVAAGLEEKHFILPNCDLILTRCGIGKTCAASKAQKTIMTYSPSHLFVCGVAGAVSKDLNVFDVVVPDLVVHGDMNIGGTYCASGVFDSVAPAFEGNPAFSKDGFSLETFNSAYRGGILATLDRFAEEDDKVFLERQFKAVAIDMESAAAVQVAVMNNVPATVVRAISDNRSHSFGDFAANAPKACDCAAEALLHFIALL
jgi:adenosylhomocysteine nucleosidase